MRKKQQTKKNFKILLEKYLNIKGLDIIVNLNNGNTIELYKNRSLDKNSIVMINKLNEKIKIPLSQVKSIDMFAA